MDSLWDNVSSSVPRFRGFASLSDATPSGLPTLLFSLLLLPWVAVVLGVASWLFAGFGGPWSKFGWFRYVFGWGLVLASFGGSVWFCGSFSFWLGACWVLVGFGSVFGLGHDFVTFPVQRSGFGQIYGFDIVWARILV